MCITSAFNMTGQLDLVKFCPGGGRAGRLQFDNLKTTGHIDV
jgi:hypothetical protein